MEEEPLLLEPLLKKHAEKIAKLRKALGEEIQGSDEDDDVFLLRYVLSSKQKTAEALKRIRKRREYLRANSEWLTLDKEAPHDAKFRRYMASDIHAHGQRDGGPLHLVRGGVVNSQAIMKCVSKEELSQWFVHQKLQAWEVCDRLTRESGRIIKLVSIIDLNNFSMWSADSTFRQALGDSSKLSENLFPQLQGKTVILHPGAAFSMMFKIFSLLMSKAMVEKVATCSGTYHTGKTINDCPYVARTFESPDLVPSYAGGGCHCTERGGCVHGVPNEQTEMLQ